MTKRQSYSREFKLEAVRLLNEGKKKGADLARELGIKRNQLYKWKEEIEVYGDDAFPRKRGQTQLKKIGVSQAGVGQLMCFSATAPALLYLPTSL